MGEVNRPKGRKNIVIMARKGKYRDVAPVLLKRISEGDTNAAACKFTGISEETFYKWLRIKDDFAEAVKKAQQDFMKNIQARLEATLWEKALGGKKIEEVVSEYAAGADGKPVIVKQRRTSKTMNADTAALIFALTNVDPAKWVNRQETKSDVAVSGITVNVDTPSQKEMLESIEELGV